MGGYPACSPAATEQEAGFTVDRCILTKSQKQYFSTICMKEYTASDVLMFQKHLFYSIRYWTEKKPQKKKIKQTNLHFLFESHDPHHMRTLHKNSGGRGFPSGHARDGCLRTGTKLLIPDFPGSHVPFNASFHAYTDHNKVFLFYSLQSSCPFFFKFEIVST